MIAFDDALIFADPPYLVTEFYPVAPQVSVRGFFLFSEDAQYVMAMFDWSPDIEGLDPDTEVDAELWERAIRSIKSELDEHCIRHGLRQAPIGEAQ